MDALRSIAAQVPGWLPRLDDLSAQIEQRQIDLAACADSASVRAPSLRNRGSTESLRPKDEDAERAKAGENADDVVEVENETPAVAATATTDQPAEPAPSDKTPKATPQDAATSMPAPPRQRQRQTVQRKQKSDSVASINLDEVTSPAAAAAVAACRTRTMIIVYYDSYVQSFFEDLVKFISVSRNHMRKAKMAAKVAQIKKMAEDEFNAEDPSSPTFRLPTVRRANRYGPTSTNLKDKFSDVYSLLDEHLEFVQTTSERAAHQFLREGDCDAEIAKIRHRLKQALELAQLEMERLLKEDPDLANENLDLRARTHKPAYMRRDPTVKKTGATDANGVTITPAPVLEAADHAMDAHLIVAGDAPIVPDSKIIAADSIMAAADSVIAADSIIAVDAAIPAASPKMDAPPTPSLLSAPAVKRPLGNDVIEAADADEGIEADFQPAKIQYRSTRAMRRV